MPIGDYARNRYYDPARGRFTTPDPAASGTISRPNSWNRYSYTEGDPVNYNDPEGLFVWNPNYGQPTSPWGGSLFWGSMLPGPVHQPMLGLDGPGGGGGGAGPLKPIGYAGAIKDLLKPNCYKLFGFSSADAAQKAFQGVSFQLTHLGQLQVGPDTSGALETLEGAQPAQNNPGGSNTVQVNYDFNWLDFSSVTAFNVKTNATVQFNYLGGLNAKLGTNMSSSDAANLILLHEFRHTSWLRDVLVCHFAQAIDTKRVDQIHTPPVSKTTVWPVRLYACDMC
jgi:hypothetical protein